MHYGKNRIIFQIDNLNFIMVVENDIIISFRQSNSGDYPTCGMALEPVIVPTSSKPRYRFHIFRSGKCKMIYFMLQSHLFLIIF